MRLSAGDYDIRNSETRKKGAAPDPGSDFASSPRAFIVELAKIVLIALAIVIPVRYFLFQPFYVEGASMEPNFSDYQYLLIDEITYRFSEPQRGDVVVLKIPSQRDALIKRVIGLPNETVEIRNQRVFITQADGQSAELNEPYLGDGIVTPGSSSTTLGPDMYFVMGDNRPVSLDSRIFGTVIKKQIIGRAWLRVWPFKEFEHFTPPVY
ncbi:MAG: signal peptidase I [Patescibacteria group bacterium]